MTHEQTDTGALYNRQDKPFSLKVTDDPYDLVLFYFSQRCWTNLKERRMQVDTVAYLVFSAASLPWRNSWVMCVAWPWVLSLGNAGSGGSNWYRRTQGCLSTVLFTSNVPPLNGQTVSPCLPRNKWLSQRVTCHLVTLALQIIWWLCPATSGHQIEHQTSGVKIARKTGANVTTGLEMK